MKHCFNTEIAKECGINAAVIFENLAFWISHNEATGRNHKEGRYWVYMTQKQLAEQFEYLSEKQVRTAIEKLADSDLIIISNHNRHKYDRTRWFALSEKGYTYSPQGHKGETTKDKEKPSEGAPIPDIKEKSKNTDIEKRIIELKKRCSIA